MKRIESASLRFTRSIAPGGLITEQAFSIPVRFPAFIDTVVLSLHTSQVTTFAIRQNCQARFAFTVENNSNDGFLANNGYSFNPSFNVRSGETVVCPLQMFVPANTNLIITYTVFMAAVEADVTTSYGYCLFNFEDLVGGGLI